MSGSTLTDLIEALQEFTSTIEHGLEAIHDELKEIHAQFTEGLVLRFEDSAGRESAGGTSHHGAPRRAARGRAEISE